jgi:ABC-2 type transport system ATP-binding protein
LLALDTPGALRASLPGTLFEIVTPDSRRAQRLLHERGFTSEVFGDRVHVWIGGPRATTPAALHDAVRGVLPDARLRQITPSLEDVYIARLSETRS